MLGLVCVKKKFLVKHFFFTHTVFTSQIHLSLLLSNDPLLMNAFLIHETKYRGYEETFKGGTTVFNQ